MICFVLLDSINDIRSYSRIKHFVVFIGNNVWIGENVNILPGVFIGDNCIIGAGSVVTGYFLANSIIVGNPARVIKKYDFDIKRWVKV